jgi:hypothetical protein
LGSLATSTTFIQERNPRGGVFANNAFQAMGGDFWSPVFPIAAGRLAAPATTAIANSFVNLANHWVGQPIDGSHNARSEKTRSSAQVRLLTA